MSGAVCYVVFWTKRVHMASRRSFRKYLARNRRTWTENPAHAWYTTSHDDADRLAKELSMGDTEPVRCEARELLHATAKFGEAQTPTVGKAIR